MTTDVPAPGRTALRCLVVTLLLTVALLDTARTGIGLRGLSHPTTGSAVRAGAGVAAAFVVFAVVDGWVAGRRWAHWAALTVGIASGPQAAAYGFTGSYAGVDLATAVLGIALSTTLLAAGPTRRQPVRPPPPGSTDATAPRHLGGNLG